MVLHPGVTVFLIFSAVKIAVVASNPCLQPSDTSLLKLLLQENIDAETLKSLEQQNRNCKPEVESTSLSTNPRQNILLLPVYPNCGKSAPSTRTQIKVRIAGGSDAGLGTYPWMALIGYKYRKSNEVQFGCGGTLINENYILTAAHCVEGLPQGYAPTTVRLGEYNMSSTTINCVGQICAPRPQDIPIQERIPHENYSKLGKKENDIALIRLQNSAKLGEFVSPVCLPQGIEARNANLKYTSLTVAGWGRRTDTNPDNYSILQMVQVPFQPVEKCRAIYGSEFGQQVGQGDGRFCVGGEIGRDSCKGDSGGPLMLDASKNNPGVTQVGVVSLGPSICDSSSKIPGLYTNVSHYMPWILKHISQ